MRILALALVGVMLAGLTAAADDTSQRFFPYDYENYTLENGFKSILIPIEGSGLVGYYTVVRTGSRDETSEISGVSHFLEHMLFKGTETRSPLQVNEAFEAFITASQTSGQAVSEARTYAEQTLTETGGQVGESLYRELMKADPNAAELQFLWSQVAGPAVVLSSTASVCSFAPLKPALSAVAKQRTV